MKCLHFWHIDLQDLAFSIWKEVDIVRVGCRERFVSCLDCFMEGSAVFFVCVFDVWFILLVGGRFWVLVA